MAQLSVTEYAVLGLLAEAPTHGFALSRQLGPGSDVGRVLTVRRPLVYRALDRLVEEGLAQRILTEKGEAGPERTIHRASRRGRAVLHSWLDEPVEHVREIRIGLLLKLTLMKRSGRSPLTLIRSQKSVLHPTLEALHETDSDDPVEMWRHHSAVATTAFLDDLESRLG